MKYTLFLSILVTAYGFSPAQATDSMVTDTISQSQKDTTSETTTTQAIDTTKTEKSDTPDTVKESRTIDSASEIVVKDSLKQTGPAASSKDTIIVKKEPALLVKSRKDTVVMIVDDVDDIITKIKGGVKKSRQQGFGGAGGPVPSIMAFNMKPVAKLIEYERARTKAPPARFTFPGLKDGYRVFTMGGGMGYAGVGNGIRIGGGGWGSTVRYNSEFYGEDEDSVTQLKVHVGFGGLLIEKAMVYNHFNFVTGGFLAFGSFEVTPEFGKHGQSAFRFKADDKDFGNVSEVTAKFMGVELHTGGTYTLLPWFHVGGDITTLCVFSNEGFSSAGSTGFFGFYPGMRLRIIFGNLG